MTASAVHCRWKRFWYCRRVAVLFCWFRRNADWLSGPRVGMKVRCCTGWCWRTGTTGNKTLTDNKYCRYVCSLLVQYLHCLTHKNVREKNRERNAGNGQTTPNENGTRGPGFWRGDIWETEALNSMPYYYPEKMYMLNAWKCASRIQCKAKTGCNGRGTNFDECFPVIALPILYHKDLKLGMERIMFSKA